MVRDRNQGFSRMLTISHTAALAASGRAKVGQHIWNERPYVKVGNLQKALGRVGWLCVNSHESKTRIPSKCQTWEMEYTNKQSHFVPSIVRSAFTILTFRVPRQMDNVDLDDISKVSTLHIEKSKRVKQISRHHFAFLITLQVCITG